MPKSVTLAAHLSTEQLKHRYRKSSNSIELRRWHLLWKIAQGWTMKNSAVAVGISYEYAQKIVTHYNLQGEQGVIAKAKRQQTGETPPLLNVNTDWFNVFLKAFAHEVGANEEKVILLMMDNAGWHKSQRVKFRKGIEPEFLPPYSPELQPAERLWCLVDEPLINEHFSTLSELEYVLSTCCCVLSEMTEEIKNLTNFHWLKMS